MQQFRQHHTSSTGDKSMPVAALLRATANNSYANPHITLTRDGMSPDRTLAHSHGTVNSDRAIRDHCGQQHDDAHYPHAYCRHTAGQPSMNTGQPIMNRQEYHERLAVAEALSRTSMMTSPAARRRLAARKVEIDLMAGHAAGNALDEGYWDEDFDYVPPKQLLMYMVR